MLHQFLLTMNFKTTHIIFRYHQNKETSKEDMLFWLIIIILCVPIVMSRVYKQAALQQPTISLVLSSLDPILINNWVSLFQFMCGLVLVIPSVSLLSFPKVHLLEIMSNRIDRIGCLFKQTN